MKAAKGPVIKENKPRWTPGWSGWHLKMTRLERLVRTWRKTIFSLTTKFVSTKLALATSVRTHSNVIWCAAKLSSVCRECHGRSKRELTTGILSKVC